MAIGFGPGSDMVRTVNKQRGGSKKRTLKESSKNTELSKKDKSGIAYQSASPEVLEKIQLKAKQERKRKIIGNIIFAVVLIGIVLYILQLPLF